MFAGMSARERRNFYRRSLAKVRASVDPNFDA
jgi:hypothetical protein